eukprot:c11262_g1_i2.p1 GENE.c11262_g1_i2~~c11262_g1_i2.p1  ORF type:complete len:449 (-),score=110.15 c11262_g1_i2:93-1367(-)
MKQFGLKKRQQVVDRDKLFAACAAGDLAKVTKYVERDSTCVNSFDDNRDTPLTIACKHGHGSVIRFLLTQPNIAVSCENVDGETALQLAEGTCEPDVYASLLKLASTADTFIAPSVIGDRSFSTLSAKTTPRKITLASRVASISVSGIQVMRSNSRKFNVPASPRDSSAANSWQPILPQEVVKQGYVLKRSGGHNTVSVGQVIQTWKRDYFILTKDKLYYFENETCAKEGGDGPLGVMSLTAFRMDLSNTADSKVQCLLRNDQRDLFLRGESPTEMNEWCMHLRALPGCGSLNDDETSATPRTLASQVLSAVGQKKNKRSSLKDGDMSALDQMTYFTEWVARHEGCASDQVNVRDYFLLEKVRRGTADMHYPRYLVFTDDKLYLVEPPTNVLKRMWSLADLREVTYDLARLILKIKLSHSSCVF